MTKQERRRRRCGSYCATKFCAPKKRRSGCSLNSRRKVLVLAYSSHFTTYHIIFWRSTSNWGRLEMDSSDRDSNSKNIRPTKSPSSALICSSMLPTATAPRRRRRRRGRWWHSPMMRGRRRVTRYLVSWRRAHRRGMRSRGCPSWCFRRLRRMLGRSRSLCRVRIRRVSLCRWRLVCRCLHRSRSLTLRRRVTLRSGHRRATESAAHSEHHHHLLYCLVHCRVPFVVRASPFSRLHRDRTIRRKFLTKDFETDNRSDESAARDHEIRLAKAIAAALRVLQRGSVAPRRTM